MKKKILLILLGLLLSIFLLELGMRAAGFISLYLQNKENMRSLNKKDTCKILCLGESTTANEYPRFLEEELNNRNLSMKFSVIDKGLGGTDTNHILDNLGNYLDQYKPDIVITMVGINDYRNIVYERAGGNRFVRSLKVYKLARLLKLHLRSKLEEIRITKEVLRISKEGVLTIKKGIRDTAAKVAGKIENRKWVRGKIKPGIIENNIVKPVGDKEIGQARKKSRYKGKQVSEEVVEQANGCMSIGMTEEAKKLYKKAIEIDPASDQGYLGLGCVYSMEASYEEAEKMCKKAIELNPEEASNYSVLGYCYMKTNKYRESENMYKKSIEIDPAFDQGYVGLGDVYIKEGKCEEAEGVYSKAIEVNPTDQGLYLELAKTYVCSKNNNLRPVKESSKLIENAVKKALALDFKNDRGYRFLYELSKQYCTKEVSDKYLDKINQFESNSYYFYTKLNYNKLVNILKKKGVKYICVQYPMRSMRLITKILESKEGIVFVDNEKIFKDAVDKEGYDAIFRDQFAGDFGHCTDKGNKLLARNIADVIIKEVFPRR